MFANISNQLQDTIIFINQVPQLHDRVQSTCGHCGSTYPEKCGRLEEKMKEKSGLDYMKKENYCISLFLSPCLSLSSFTPHHSRLLSSPLLLPLLIYFLLPPILGNFRGNKFITLTTQQTVTVGKLVADLLVMWSAETEIKAARRQQLFY